MGDQRSWRPRAFTGGMLAFVSATALTACGGESASEVTCGELGLAPRSAQLDDPKLDETVQELADETDPASDEERLSVEAKIDGAILGICVRENDPEHMPAEEALRVSQEPG